MDRHSDVLNAYFHVGEKLPECFFEVIMGSILYNEALGCLFMNEMIHKLLDFFHDFFEVFLKVLNWFEVEVDFFNLNFNILLVNLGEGGKLDFQMADGAWMESIRRSEEVFLVDFINIELKIGQLDDTWHQALVADFLVFDQLLKKLFQRKLYESIDRIELCDFSLDGIGRIAKKVFQIAGVIHKRKCCCLDTKLIII